MDPACAAHVYIYIYIYVYIYIYACNVYVCIYIYMYTPVKASGEWKCFSPPMDKVEEKHKAGAEVNYSLPRPHWWEISVLILRFDVWEKQTYTGRRTRLGVSVYAIAQPQPTYVSCHRCTAYHGRTRSRSKAEPILEHRSHHTGTLNKLIVASFAVSENAIPTVIVNQRCIGGNHSSHTTSLYAI